MPACHTNEWHEAFQFKSEERDTQEKGSFIGDDVSVTNGIAPRLFNSLEGPERRFKIAHLRLIARDELLIGLVVAPDHVAQFTPLIGQPDAGGSAVPLRILLEESPG